MLLRPLNFLLLDEPTHHLDIQSKDVLKEALKNYDGTFLLVSHDRDFLHGLTHRILELDGGRIRDQHLDILELIEKRKALQAADMGASSARTAPAKAAGAQRSDYHERKERDKERRRVQNQVERAEKELAALEQEEKALQAQVMAVGLPAAELDKGYARLGELAQRIAVVMADWEYAAARLNELDVEV
jgi:ATP-binding cassette subfamily F protein 3